MLDTFSDTLELPDTLPDTVLEVFNDFSKSYARLQWPTIISRVKREGCDRQRGVKRNMF